MAETHKLDLPVRAAGEEAATQHDSPASIPTPIISEALYAKARDHNDQLTKLERLLFLSRCDIQGKVLAEPSTITEAERNQILLRPPPAMLEANIRTMTNNTMSTIDELVADNCRSLDYWGVQAIVLGFWYRETSSLQFMQFPEFRGTANNAASRLLNKPVERALHQEACRRLHDPDLIPAELRRTSDPVADRLRGREIKEERRKQSENMEKVGKELHAQLLLERQKFRAEMTVRVLAELQSLSEAEAEEMRQLRERMRAERDREVEEEAHEARRKAAERKREIEAIENEAREEARSKRRAKRAFLKAKYGDADYSDSPDSDGDDREPGEYPTSEDT